MLAGEQAEALLASLESILLVAPEPLTVAALASACSCSRKDVTRALEQLNTRLTGGIRLQEHAGRFRLVTAPENAEVVRRFLGTAKPPPLSRAALETLTVVAYYQPATRAEIEATRGVDSDRPLRTLLDRGLVEEVGRRPVIGRPAEYATTDEFLSYFGLGSLRDLPQLERNDGPAAGQLGLRNASNDEEAADWPPPSGV